MDESNIPHREIDADEEELLNRIWAGLPEGRDTEARTRSGFEDLERRIRRKERLRRNLRLALTGSAAAAVATAAVLLHRAAPAPQIESFAQLEKMGVSVDRGEVVMSADDGLRIRLEGAASIQRQDDGEVALRSGQNTRRALSAAQMLKVEVPNGRQFHLTLSDGSEVWLNAGSVLEYPAAFDDRPERRVRLTGEAFFEVARDTCRPFCVEIGTNECIRVLGTSFNVRAYAEAERHVTTLVTGRIGYNGRAAGEELVLQPDQQLEVDCATGCAHVQRVDASAYGAWKDGWLWFEAEKLPALAERLSRMYGIRVTVSDRLSEYSFSGRIRQERGIEYILGLLSETTDIVCKVDDDGVMRLE